MLLGHWGTKPGQNFIYFYLNRVIKEYEPDLICVAGPTMVGNHYLEGTFNEIYPAISENEAGLHRLFK
jgi:xylulose-5-phosphate/fructose-6-phosphate phosphoketolase